MNSILLRCGWVLARFHRWATAVFFFSLARPVSRWDERSRGSFAYACMMSAERQGTRKRFLKIAGCERDRMPEANLWLAKIAWTLQQPELAAELYRATEVMGDDAVLKQTAQAMRRFVESVLDGTIHSAVSDAVDRASLPEPGNVPVILTPLSSRYFDLFGLWSEQLDKHAQGHRLILALDEAAKLHAGKEARCSVIDFSSYFVFQEGGSINKYCRSLIWVFRVLLLRELAARGYPVCSLDLDAVAVGNVQEMMSGLPEADVVAQKDYSIPMDVARELGFILCCGFMVFRPGQAVVEFLDRYSRQTVRELDDQLALNHLLQRDGVEDRMTRPESMSFRSCGLTWICPDTSLVSRDLRYGTVIRHFQQTGESVDELKQAMGL